ncbi:(2,3-dihydroxybenzoyl)adenylate synthase [Saccharopolyspora sp. ASAGF58]|uniref:(2,3-dihydroxybenzoyl)adenylate synthase n=1 Tax=Saccharopolyspora sp. ASAGF58 TaxID=2719023 RepID=UPI0014401E69|nr:(2,3-dihydroxybenzoyl)adenylate synthase [Saccharopolyspora sp. ASAGF58]QIZ37206.1 (2,3-dihydroxybenzoyl)adenylate synthase [Saccharopolyspora sp. ASAGF58]
MTQDWPGWPDSDAQRYRAAGYWAGRTFDQLVTSWARDHGERTALVDGERRFSYAALDAEIDRVARGLRGLGVERGDRFIVQLPNIAEFVIGWFALQRVGAVPVHAMPAHRAAEIDHLARLSGAVGYLITDRHSRFDYRELAAEVQRTRQLRHVIVVGDPGEHGFVGFTELAERSGPAATGTSSSEDLALLLLSGGTTGLPKLIPRTHDDYAYNARASSEVCGLTADSVYLAVLPIGFNYTWCCPGALGTWCAGGTVVLAPNPSPETVFSLIEREKVTIAAVNPPLVPYLLAEYEVSRPDLSTLRLLQVGSARLADDLARRITPELGVPIQQVFGMAEGLLNYTRLDDPDELRCTTQGVPLSPDDEIRVVDEDDRTVPDGEPGELLTRGPYTLRGYYRAAEHNERSFTADGFYRTGDLVRQLPSGHLVVVGRVKDQINRGGEKIPSTEVEGHLLAHPAVKSAALVAQPDPVFGEIPVAFLVCHDRPPSLPEVTAFLKQRGLAAYKLPARLEIVDEFPHTAVGKIDKKALSERLQA